MNKQDWTYKTIEDACSINYGTRVVQKKDKGSTYYVYGGGGATFMIDRYNREDCFIVSRFAMSPKCTRYVEGKFFLNDSGLSVSTNDEGFLCQKFLDKVLLANNDNIYAMGKGMAQRNLDMPSFRKLIIPVPPLAEQERIVAELDLLSGIIEKKKEQLKAYDQLAQSIFYTMFGDPIDNSKGWEVKKLGEICENCDSMRKPITAKDREQGEIPYYGASGIVDYVKDYIFDGDYLLISEDGANLIARSTPIAFSIKGKTWVNNHAHVLKFTNQITQQYVEFSINLRDVSAIVTGCAQPKLTQANLNRILISFPPLSLQQEFAEKVEAIERQKALVQQSIDETQTMFDYTMDKYFG